MGILSKLFSRRQAASNAEWLQTAVAGAARTLGAGHAATLRAAQRSFEAADTPAYTDSWAGASGYINDELAAKLPTMRARSVNLGRDDEWATRYLIQVDDNVLGPQGIRLQCRVKMRGSDAFDVVANNALERFWERWGERGVCEASGRMDWREVEGLLARSWKTKGEILLRHMDGAGPLGYQVKVLPPEVLDVQCKRTFEGRRVRMGVEVDDNGAAVAYWLKGHKVGDDPSAEVLQVGQHVRVPARQIIHRFRVLEEDQLRGIPELSVGARRLWLLHEFENAASVASNNAAKRQGFFVSPDGNAPPGFADQIISAVLDAARAQGKELSTEEIQALQSSAQRFSTLVPGQFDTLPQGYDFRPFESKWPEVNASGFIKDQIRGFSAARGVSYHTLGNDLSDVNYSSAQVGILDEREHFKSEQRTFSSWLHKEVGKRVIARAVLYEADLQPSRLAEYQAAAKWLGRTWQAIDPRKQSEADDINLRNESTTRRQIWIAKGLDPDDMEREILAERERFGRLEQPAAGATPAQRYSAEDPPEPARPRLVSGG